MGKITNIIDALRRKGGPTQKLAIARQDMQLEGKDVLERGRRIFRDPLGDVESFVATIAPIPETVEVLSEAELQPIRENAALVQQFLERFDSHSPNDWALEDLDQAFKAWVCSDNKRGFSEETVVEVVGAAFGEYCARQLNMHWIRVTDQDGTALAVDGIEKEFRAFPYQTIMKRITASEYGFFRPVFTMIKSYAEGAQSRAKT
jgi:hypothetical protein